MNIIEIILYGTKISLYIAPLITPLNIAAVLFIGATSYIHAHKYISEYLIITKIL